mmetsp:Transcript_38110/g.58133  ORF Transcript_38110/g.58133 Transcript_38110/m.58133 type:complete len:137 (+) Transcript_38110:1757-2167(+)
MSGATGKYEGFLNLDDEPCSWGRWLGKNRVIYGYWNPDGDNNNEKIDGTVMDITEHGMFLGQYSMGERNDYGLWREMQENEPRQVEGHYVDGKQSGSQFGFEILDSGSPGELVYEELYVKGDRKSREEYNQKENES